jgi:hypothetical protein
MNQIMVETIKGCVVLHNGATIYFQEGVIVSHQLLEFSKVQLYSSYTYTSSDSTLIIQTHTQCHTHLPCGNSAAIAIAVSATNTHTLVVRILVYYGALLSINRY